jgi:hypothetical protein
MHLLYPCSPLRSRQPDEQYQAEVEAVRSEGFVISLFSVEAFQAGDFKASPPLPTNAEVLYRGWMLSKDEYASLVAIIRSSGSEPVSDLTSYLACHYLPNWYPLLSEFTPETKIYPADCDLAEELKTLGWSEYFINDYVKSLKTSVGSRISKPEQVQAVVSDMKRFRGTIEGGLCVRRVENFLSESERRYFVFDGKPRASEGEVPEIVQQCVSRVKSRFFSVDVIQRADGGSRIVEVGDGQVSDLVGWSPERFAKVLAQNFLNRN